MIAITEPEYKRKITLSEDEFSRITARIGRERLYRRMEIVGNCTYYSLDELGRQIIRTNRRTNTIEIGYGIPQEKMSLLDEIIIKEIRGEI